MTPLLELDALQWVERLIAVAIFFQSVELLQLRAAWADDGIWAWPVLRGDFMSFSKGFRRILDVTLGARGFAGLLVLQCLAALALFYFPHPAPVLILLLGTVLISLRWRGSFNGGSDFMTLIVLQGLLVATLFPGSHVARAGALWYIAIQACTSYFVSGAIKLRRKNWRDGHALTAFLGTSIYGPSPLTRAVRSRPLLAIMASWLVMIFECGFPGLLWDPRLCLLGIAAALLFHLCNFRLFGLNRFLLAWTATYPALYYGSGYLQTLLRG